MKDKEKLLSIDNPLRFIFSHSALREGWDNPNVFQICTLNETKSTIKKRQEIGRGLRLPVDQTGNRVFDSSINYLTVFANESYETFAKTLQREYEEDCGVTFGAVSKYAFSRIVEINEDEESAVGRKKSELIWGRLLERGILDEKGRITSKFKPTEPNFDLGLDSHDHHLVSDVISVIDSYRLERHLKKDEQPEKIRVKSKKELSEQDLDVEFKELWDRIKHKTTYRVEYESDYLIRRCSDAIGVMDAIEKVEINYMEAELDIGKKGVKADLIRTNQHKYDYTGPLPDLVSYIQRETELTRRTIVQILTKSGRLNDFLNNPQKFMDTVARIINLELNKLIVDGIKYEKVDGEYYDMKLFEEKELLAYLSNRLKVSKSVYDYIVYDSNTELQYAQRLDNDRNVKLFLKLPTWFRVKTPIGEYNPDWAIVRYDDSKVYLVRETKGLTNALSYRGGEMLKIKCGKKHFNSLGIDYAVITDPVKGI
jgi:type III restriction enzyme